MVAVGAPNRRIYLGGCLLTNLILAHKEKRSRKRGCYTSNPKKQQQLNNTRKAVSPACLLLLAFEPLKTNQEKIPEKTEGNSLWLVATPSKPILSLLPHSYLEPRRFVERPEVIRDDARLKKPTRGTGFGGQQMSVFSCHPDGLNEKNQGFHTANLVFR